MTVHERPFGRYFEDFEPGDVYKHWPGKTITEYDDHLFCMITMNHHPLHTDAWFAETQTQFGKNVVVGNLVYSLVLGMSVPDVSGVAIANLEVEELKHKMPTFHGDTIYAETKVLDKKESSSKPDRGVVAVETLLDLPLPFVGPFFLDVQRVTAAVTAAMEAEGSFVAENNVVSQSVPHLHVHVVPRRRKDGLRGFFWPRTRYESETQMAAVAA